MLTVLEKLAPTIAAAMSSRPPYMDGALVLGYPLHSPAARGEMQNMVPRLMVPTRGNNVDALDSRPNEVRAM